VCKPDAGTDRVYRTLVELSEVLGSPFAYRVPEGLMEQAPTGLMLYRSGVAIIIIRYGSPPKSAGLRGGPRGGT
jgi:hypothetical protein